ncbi:MAG: hypothetical protein K2M16_07525 [Muribaculaceae bacterium]|nr:hypothetical protein [Muribaculaceae bacterium]
MEFNYFKTSVMSAMAVGALAFSASMMAAAPVSVLPAEGAQETLEDFTLIFNEGDVVAWNVSGTENAPYLTRDGQRIATVGTPTALSAVGNTLSINTGDEYYRAGQYQLNVAAGSYTVNGAAGDACKFTWDVSGVLIGYSVEPATSVVTEIQNVRFTFNDNDVVTLTDDWGTDHGAILYLETEQGLERRGTLFPSVAGNTLLLTMNSPIYEPGEYVIEVSPNCVLLDGKLYDEIIRARYTVVEPAYPEVDLSVFPASNIVETLDKIEVTFGGVDVVTWAVTGTENAPYMVDQNGDRIATFTVLGGQGNMLSLGFYEEFSKKGEYTVVIPEGSYVLEGIYHGMPGKGLTLNYQVLGIGGLTVDPAVDVLNELKYIKVTFNDAEVVTLADDLGTDNTPYVDYVTADGVRERRHTLFPNVSGNTLHLTTMYDPIYEPGEYVVVVPGSCYFLDGNPGETFELIYKIVEPSYPEVELSVNPAVDVVETLDTIEVTFGGVEIVEWVVTGTENAPYLRDMDGNRWATFSQLSGLGNMLSLGFLNEFAVKGEYEVVIPEGSYVFQGIYHGMPGNEIVLHYEVLGVGGITVEPAVNTLTELSLVKITFNDAQAVTLSENLGTDNTPYVDYVNEEGVRERRHTLYPEVAGNALYLRTMNDPIIEEGEYIVVLPGSCYFLDGNEGETIELGYTIIEPTYPEIELSVNPAVDVVETLDTIEVTFGGVETVEWAVTGTENAPYMVNEEGNRVATFSQLGGLGNMLSLGFYDEFTKKGNYTIIIPEGSYVLQGEYHGMPGKEITLHYEVLGIGGISVEPAVDTVMELQYVSITFNDATEVTLAEDLGTGNTPYVAIVNEEGEREYRATLFPDVAGNLLALRTMYEPITEPGQYVVVVPGTTYFLDGAAGFDIELNYTVTGDGKIKYTVNPADGSQLSELHTFEITFDEANEVFWNMEGLQADSSLYPVITRDGQNEEQITDVYSYQNVLYAARESFESWTELGYYVVTIKEGSYYVDGVMGPEIVLTYLINPTAVDAIFGEKANMDVYDLNGRMILRNADANAVKALRGIFVIDGKKYILR